MFPLTPALQSSEDIENIRLLELQIMLTGLNEAFIIDSNTRDRLIQEHNKSADVIKPLLRGRDAARWKNRDSGTYLITITGASGALKHTNSVTLVVQ